MQNLLAPLILVAMMMISIQGKKEAEDACKGNLTDADKKGPCKVSGAKILIPPRKERIA